MLTDRWRFVVRGHYAVKNGGGLAWAEGFSSGAERDAKLLSAAREIRAGQLEMVTVESHVAPWRRKQSLRSPEQVQMWIERIGKALP